MYNTDSIAIFISGDEETDAYRGSFASSSLPIFINKELLEHSDAHSLHSM